MKLLSIDDWIIAKPESNDRTTRGGLFLPDSTYEAQRMRVVVDQQWLFLGNDEKHLVADSVILVDPQARVINLPDGLVAFKDDAVIAKVIEE